MRLLKGMIVIRAWHVLAFVFASIIALSFHFDDNYLITRQERLQRLIYSPAVNSMVYDYCSYNTHCFILTNFELLKFLPGLEDHSLVIDMSDGKEFFDKIRMPEITEVLVREKDLSEEIIQFLGDKLRSGEYTLIGYTSGCNLIKVK